MTKRSEPVMCTECEEAYERESRRDDGMNWDGTDPNRIYHLPVAEVLQMVRESCDYSQSFTHPGVWHRFLAYKADYRLAHIVHLLLEGVEMDPIVLCEPQGTEWTFTYKVGNGNHRLAAYILCGRDTIPVVFTKYSIGSKTGQSHNRGSWNPNWGKWSDVDQEVARDEAYEIKQWLLKMR